MLKMERPIKLTIFFYIITLFSVATSQPSNNLTPAQFHVGVILDSTSLVGKIGQTSITMAVEDFYTMHENYRTRLTLHKRDANSDDLQASSAALDLLQNMKTEAIIGPQQSSQAVMISKIGNKTQVPVISFSASSPTLSSMNLPYFIRTTINDAAEVHAITALIKSYGWREVVPIYEDTEFGRGIIPFLADALQEIDVRIPYRSLISESSTDGQIQEELYKLQTMQTRVFVVHMTPSKGATLFLKARELGMMEEGYVWIMTNGLVNVIECFNRNVVRAMSGALGVRPYVPKTVKLENFATRWRKRFQEDNPNDEPCEVSTFSIWAYDTVNALALAVEKVGVQSTKLEENFTSCVHLPVFSNGPQLLKAISNIKFQGLNGNFELRDGQLQYSTFEIINVVGTGIREIGYWREKQGLSRRVDANSNKTYSASLPDLNPIIWPGESIIVPKGWEIPVSGRKLRVGVRMTPTPGFMNVEIDPVTNAIIASGYAIDVFEEAIKRLPYAVPFEYKLFGDTSESSLKLSYDDYVYQVYLRNYDVVIGDITIRYNRTRYVDFSVPYTESGIGMIVPVKEAVNRNTLIFLKPLTADLWLVSIVFVIYTGIAILILEPKMRAPLRGSLSMHLHTIVHLSFFAYKEKLESILSKIVVMVWVFVLLVLTSSYTASLTSMLTVQQLQPTVTDIHDLLNKGDYIGYKKDSFVEGLIQQIGFDESKMRGYSYPEEFDEALKKGSANGGVSVIVHSIPYIKLFLAKYCDSYTMVGPIFKTAGYGFAFPKGSPLVPDISHAILNITDGDDIIRIEKKWIGDKNCHNTGSIIDKSNSLNFYNFWGLFLITGVVTTISLLIFAIMSFCKKRRKMISIMSLEMSSDERNDNGDLPTISQEEYQKSDIFGPSPDKHNNDASPQMP
ncbi:glutamate receptor 2.7-like isoform X1 [Carex rostrata]